MLIVFDSTGHPTAFDKMRIYSFLDSSSSDTKTQYSPAAFICISPFIVLTCFSFTTESQNTIVMSFLSGFWNANTRVLLK